MTPEKTKKIVITLSLFAVVVGIVGVLCVSYQVIRWQQNVLLSVATKTDSQITKDAPPVSENAIVVDGDKWKTYTSKTSGYAIKYPESFQVKEETSADTLFSTTDGYFRISTKNNDISTDPIAIKDSYYRNDQYGYQYQDSFPIIAGVKSYKQGRYDGGVMERYFVPYSGKIYTIEFEFSFYPPDQALSDTKIAFIQNVISTMSFTNDTTSDMTKWKTYANETYGIEFRYPSDWKMHDLIPTNGNLFTVGMGAPGLGDDTVWVNISSQSDLRTAINTHVKTYITGTKIEKEQTSVLGGAGGILVYLNVGGNSSRLDRWVFAEHDTKVYSMGITNDVAPYDKEFYQILSTFKFTK
ncbi:MAG: hypothetical protein Q8P11_03855 [bacterium]|nr:hypothetical protein [bacterium]